jgi:hypothetical protein
VKGSHLTHRFGDALFGWVAKGDEAEEGETSRCSLLALSSLDAFKATRLPGDSIKNKPPPSPPNEEAERDACLQIMSLLSLLAFACTYLMAWNGLVCQAEHPLPQAGQTAIGLIKTAHEPFIDPTHLTRTWPHAYT